MKAIKVKSILSQCIQRMVCRQYAAYSTKPDIEYPKKIVSGVQPTGTIHLGNYFGAIKRWVDLQQTDDGVYFIADLHAMTIPYEPKKLHDNIIELTATLLACGIDPNKSILYLQSTVHQHAELCWILNCLTTMPRLSKLPQFKEKSEKVKETCAGLLMYPVLQTADILLHKGTHVPCGEDQVQQLQLAQHIARVFNSTYGKTFPIIEEMIGSDESKRILSLRDPTKKQSKSDVSQASRITLRDHPDAILKKIKRALTDFTSEVTYEPMTRPGVSNLINILSQVKNVSTQQIVDEAKELNTGQFKLLVADELIALLDPIRLKIEDNLKNKDYLEAVLRQGRDKALEISEKTMTEVRQRIGTIKL